MKQPPALIPLSITEGFERFGLYVIQGLLVLYFTLYLHIKDEDAYFIWATYSALVYIGPVLGGLFADRLLGHRYSILLGAFLLVIGYFILANSGQNALFLALALNVTGTSLIKPNISSFVGDFYYPNDPRRDSGFTIFYMIFSVGILLSTASSGFIQERFGWHVVCGTAGVGILIAIAIFSFSFRYFENKGLPPPRATEKQKILLFFQSQWGIALLILLGIGFFSIIFRSKYMANLLLSAGGIITLIALLWIAFKQNKLERNKLLLLIFLIVYAIIFWSLYWQAFSTVSLFLQRNVNRHVFGITIPPSVFLFLISFFILLLGPFFAMMWQQLHIKNKGPALSTKFALALLCAAIALYSLSFSTLQNHAGIVPVLWVLPFYFILAVGELLISPIGLSMVTALAPAHLVGLMMGAWLMSLGFGGKFAGWLANFAAVPITDIGNTLASLKIYNHAFFLFGSIALVAAVVLFALTPWLKKLFSNRI